ncbi:MAG: hypothetical protein U0075_13775 [Thermomicrobiales bacterium]
MRWKSAVLLCGFMANVIAVGSQSPPSLAMQVTPPSEIASAFCSPDTFEPPDGSPWAAQDKLYEKVSFNPGEKQVGSVGVRDIINPYADFEIGSGELVMTLVTLPKHTCILESRFYPSMVMTVTSGDISILVEHWPGTNDPPKAFVVPGGSGVPMPIALDTPTHLTAGDWVKIENESFLGFSNETDVEATFTVAGIKMNDPAGGGGHTSRP